MNKKETNVTLREHSLSSSAVNFNFMLIVLENYVARKSALAGGQGRTMSKNRYNYIKS